jgi:hypothetical protein
MLFGRCPRCYDAAKLYRSEGRVLCKHCCRIVGANPRVQNHGRPDLPHDRHDARIVFQVSNIQSQM